MGIERIFIVSKSGGLIYSYDNQTPVSLSEPLPNRPIRIRYLELFKSTNRTGLFISVTVQIGND